MKIQKFLPTRRGTDETPLHRVFLVNYIWLRIHRHKRFYLIVPSAAPRLVRSVMEDFTLSFIALWHYGSLGFQTGLFLQLLSEQQFCWVVQGMEMMMMKGWDCPRGPSLYYVGRFLDFFWPTHWIVLNISKNCDFWPHPPSFFADVI